jgi:hypothetical protein
MQRDTKWDGPVPSRRLSAAVLGKVTTEHIKKAAVMLVKGEAFHRFRPSTDFDVIVDGGIKLPPKALFGVAATDALGFEVRPDHIRGALGTATFRLLQAAGYHIVPKKQTRKSVDQEWGEGTVSERRHLRRERAVGLSEAKKAAFVKEHGRLFCESCGLDPQTTYKSPAGAACIEVHHRAVQVSKMAKGHKTKLMHLQCLCANCHRVEHRKMRELSICEKF